MRKAFDVALYLSDRYRQLFGEIISEMKMHKLLYLIQREYIMRYDQVLFGDEFQGWRFGPVLPGIRQDYRAIISGHLPEIHLEKNEEDTVEEVLKRYGDKDPWSLSRLSHGEFSWQQSREGLKDNENGYSPILVQNIRVDAQRVKDRRRMIETYENNFRSGSSIR